MTQSNISSKCYEFFSVNKYYTQEYVCYLVEPTQIDLPYLSYVTTLDTPSEIYFIALGEYFDKHMLYVKVIVHSKISLPSKSKRYSLLTNVEDTKKLFSIRYVKTNITKLGYPYDTYTCVTSPDIVDKCFEDCSFDRSVALFGKVVHDLNMVTPYDYMPISVTDISNINMSKLVDRIGLECKKVCRIRFCLDVYTMTQVFRYQHDSIGFQLVVPQAPDILIIFHPLVNILDLFVYAMGAIGTWFGFAIIHIDPISMFGYVREKLCSGTSSDINRYIGNGRNKNIAVPYWWCEVNNQDIRYFGHQYHGRRDHGPALIPTTGCRPAANAVRSRLQPLLLHE